MANLVKTCKLCLVEKAIVNFPVKRKLKSGKPLYDTRCKDCINANRRKDRLKNPEKYREQERQRIRDPIKKKAWTIAWRENNKGKRLEYQRKYREVHYDEILAWARAYKDSMADSYIRQLLTGKSEILKAKDIPQELVELKRAELTIKRKLKEMTA